MKPRSRFGRTLRWTVAGSFALLFHIALFWGVVWTREPAQRLRSSQRQFTEIQYTTERTKLLDQQMTLFDPRPLLLPTEWNASNVRRLGDFTQEEADLFPDFPPKFELEDGDYLDDFGNAPATYERLASAQVEFDYPIFHEIASDRRDLPPAQAKDVEAVVIDAKNGGELRRATIYNVAGKLSATWPDWQPTTLIATIERSFLEAGVSVLRSSGYAEADQLLREATRAAFSRLGPLPDGVYFVEILP